VRAITLKLLRETVRPQNAAWAMQLAFMSAQEDLREASKIWDQLFQSFREPPKRINVIYMLHHGALLEADFVDPSDDFCLKQLVVVGGQEFFVGLHPFHSTGRIYCAVGRFLDIPISKFSLFTERNRLVPFQYPLSCLELHWSKPLLLNLEILDVPEESRDCGIVPSLLSFLSEPSRFTFLFQGMRNIFAENEVLFQILTFIGSATNSAIASTPFQLIFTGNGSGTFDHSESIRIFPYVLRCAERFGAPVSPCFLEYAMKLLVKRELDPVSYVLACQSLSVFGQGVELDWGIVKLGLIDSDSRLVHDLVSDLLGETVNPEVLYSLLHLAVKRENRSKTKAFFDLLQAKGTSSTLIEPFFRDLTQFEFSHSGEVDQTFISMLTLLDPTPENIELTFDRLFQMPTCFSSSLPFVQTPESRDAAFEFLRRGASVPGLPFLLESALRSGSSSTVHRVTDDINFKGPKALLGTDWLSLFVQLFSCIDVFVDAILSASFESRLLRNLAELFGYVRYGVPGFAPPPPAGISARSMAETIGFVFGRLSGESDFPSCLNSLFCNSDCTGLYSIFTIDTVNTHSFGDFVFDVPTLPPFFLVEIAHSSSNRTFCFPLTFASFRAAAILVKDVDGSHSIIVSAESRDWFITKNGRTDYFDISTYIELCFGNSASFTTFLIYADRKRAPACDRPINEHLKTQINSRNSALWATVACSSRGFLNFFRDYASRDIDAHLQLAFRFFTRMAVSDIRIFDEWVEWLCGALDCRERAQQFSEFCWGELGHGLVQLCSISEGVSCGLIAMIEHTTPQIPDYDFSRVFQCLRPAADTKQFALIAALIALFLRANSVSDPVSLADILGMMTASKDATVGSEQSPHVVVAFDLLMQVIEVSLTQTPDPDLESCFCRVEFLEMWV
jgi:hypothetical protein